MILVPLSVLPAQTLYIVLAEQYCTISIYWRQERLYLDLSVGATVICRGAICQNRADVLQSKSRDFSGTLLFLDLEGDRPPRWDRLHNGSTGRWMLLHIEDGEEIPAPLQA
jgi:hypothetical protein